MDKRVKHGKRNSRLYHVWSNMIERCRNKNNEAYKWYGERGISVCEEWKEFEPFYKWAVENGYADNLTIDRVNNDGNYEPSNCRWVTQKVQQNNKSNNHIVEYNGKNYTLTELAEVSNVPLKTLWYRLKNGWEVKRAVEQPVRKQRNNAVSC